LSIMPSCTIELVSQHQVLYTSMYKFNYSQALRNRGEFMHSSTSTTEFAKQRSGSSNSQY